MIEEPRDAIVRVTSCAICGSDLHLYDGFVPGMRHGDVMGHEFMGDVVEVGPAIRGSNGEARLAVGDRVVVPFTIVCGECEQCRRGNFSVCERSNRNRHAGVTAVDVATAAALSGRERRRAQRYADYSDRSGFARAPAQMRGAALKGFETPSDMRNELPNVPQAQAELNM